jgi:hypothetical protein
MRLSGLSEEDTASFLFVKILSQTKEVPHE